MEREEKRSTLDFSVCTYVLANVALPPLMVGRARGGFVLLFGLGMVRTAAAATHIKINRHHDIAGVLFAVFAGLFPHLLLMICARAPSFCQTIYAT